MNIFDKRRMVLDLQGDMLTGGKEKDDDFLSVVKFENWCCNSGLSGYAQDAHASELRSINSFGNEHDFATISKMVSVVQKYLDRYGKGLIDQLSEEEYEDLSQYDNEFYEIHDRYTDAVFKKYFEGNYRNNAVN